MKQYKRILMYDLPRGGQYPALAGSFQARVAPRTGDVHITAEHAYRGWRDIVKRVKPTRDYWPNLEDFLRQAQWLNSIQLPNVRFWIWWNDQYTKLTLRPGEVRSLYRGGPHDEGWSRHSEVYTYDVDDKPVITRQITNQSQDCDGRFDEELDHVCELGDVQSETPWDGTTGILLPGWQRTRATQRDHEAEKAGY